MLQLFFSDVADPFIESVNVVNEGDRDWKFDVQDFIIYCVSNEAHVLIFYNVNLMHFCQFS